eukprot:3807661-Pleurochrysis_carterae.AAC.1
MIAKQPGFFNKLHKESWDHFFKKISQRIEDVVETDAPRFTESDLPQCKFGLADCSALYNHQ